MKQIPLTRGKFALVDNEDFDMLNKYKWKSSNTKGKFFYAHRYIGNNQILMHRVIMNTPKGFDTDHIDHNTLNNQKENLRIVSRQLNNANRKPNTKTASGYKGLQWDGRVEKWFAKVMFNKKYIYAGSYLNKIDAAKAYNRLAKKLFGEYAYLNNV